MPKPTRLPLCIPHKSCKPLHVKCNHSRALHVRRDRHHHHDVPGVTSGVNFWLWFCTCLLTSPYHLPILSPCHSAVHSSMSSRLICWPWHTSRWPWFMFCMLWLVAFEVCWGNTKRDMSRNLLRGSWRGAFVCHHNRKCTAATTFRYIIHSCCHVAVWTYLSTQNKCRLKEKGK